MRFAVSHFRECARRQTGSARREKCEARVRGQSASCRTSCRASFRAQNDRQRCDEANERRSRCIVSRIGRVAVQPVSLCRSFSVPACTLLNGFVSAVDCRSELCDTTSNRYNVLQVVWVFRQWTEKTCSMKRRRQQLSIGCTTHSEKKERRERDNQTENNQKSSQKATKIKPKPTHQTPSSNHDHQLSSTESSARASGTRPTPCASVQMHCAD